MSGFQCRACGNVESELVLDLGLHPLANKLLRGEDLSKPEPRFPLRVAVCLKCWLLQILDIVPPVQLFSDYVYFSSFSDAMLRHVEVATERYVTDFKLGPESFVVEIASNDGYLLKNFVERRVPSLGIEPAENIAKVARECGIETRVAFFGLSFAEALAKESQADLILGNNVFAHAPEINDFIAGLRALLKPNGRIILEFPYGGDFVEKCQFDIVYHEHVFYFFLTPLLPLFKRHGLEIFDVERLTIHGGSLRLFAAHRGANPVCDSVSNLAADEKSKGVADMAFYRNFAERVGRIREDLLRLLGDLKSRRKSVAAYGASAKGSTLLNFLRLDAGTLAFIADRSTYKQGRFSPGLHLPIVSDDELQARQPDYTLLLTWNFAEEILAQQAEYRRRGGKFIVPIPQVSVI
jgi:SAM-dependent methyltransferase